MTLEELRDKLLDADQPYLTGFMLKLLDILIAERTPAARAKLMQELMETPLPSRLHVYDTADLDGAVVAAADLGTTQAVVTQGDVYQPPPGIKWIPCGPNGECYPETENT